MKQLSRIYLVSLLIAGLSGCTTIGYYTQAVSGHLDLMMRAEPVPTLLDRPDTDPALKAKLRLAVEAREFARARLALPVEDAFSTYVALERPWVLVNLMAAPEFSLTPHHWCYPVLGCQAYRGYFDLDAARAQQARLRAEGYDTLLGGVTAYSTLGWFDDPLHTGFTALDDSRMVALMFHELAHRVVYVDNDTAFNESFATAVELEGLRLWLEHQGRPERFPAALARQTQRRQTAALVAQASASLQALYQASDALTVAERRARKHRILADLAARYAELSADWAEPGPFGPPPVTLNNAHLALFQQYNQWVPGFRQLLREQDYDFQNFYAAVAALGALAPESRLRALRKLSQRFDEHL